MSASPLETKQKKDLRYYSLDFWRGMACLMVAVFHTICYVTENPAHIHGNFISKKIFSGLSQGWAGVPMFFVISGYCIAAACESAMHKGMETKTYFFRRFKRIYPPYWIVLLIVIAMHLGFLFFTNADYLADNVWPMTKPADMSFWQWVGTFTLTEGWRDHLVGPQSRIFMTHAWSLCYEEQFYFVCGMAMLVGRKWFYQFLAGLSAVVAVVAFINFAIVPLPVDGFFFDGRWLMFASGVLVFYVLQFGDERSRKRAIYLLSAGFCVAVAWALKQHLQIAKHEFVSFAFAIVLIVLFKFDRRIAESRLLKPVTLCGVMCYSLYLVHYPVERVTTRFLYEAGIQGEWSTLFVSLPISMALSIIVSWGFHVVVERRFLNTPPPPSTKPTPVKEEIAVPVTA